jgi:TRAP transporter solute receptor, TAXI family
MKKLALASMLAGAMMVTTSASAQETFVTIGTGGQTGVYYQVGGSICKLVNKNTDEHGIKCTHTTGSSVKNINGIRNGNLDMGVAQSDVQFKAYNGTSDKDFPEGAYEDLRAVFSVHAEPFTLVARADSGIKSLDDLVGKRVNIGAPGSGNRSTMEVIMERKGWTNDTFALASELKAAEMSAALCDNKLDAMIYIVGHPSGSIKEATTSCDSVLVPVTGQVIDDLVAEFPYYAKSVIPGKMYKGTDEDTPVFWRKKRRFVTAATVDEETVYQMV